VDTGLSVVSENARSGALVRTPHGRLVEAATAYKPNAKTRVVISPHLCQSLDQQGHSIFVTFVTPVTTRCAAHSGRLHLRPGERRHHPQRRHQSGVGAHGESPPVVRV